jgi:hypothetical protein
MVFSFVLECDAEVLVGIPNLALRGMLFAVLKYTYNKNLTLTFIHWRWC